MENRMAWLRDHMRNQIANTQSAEPREKVLRFPNADRSPAATAEGEGALNLVTQAAEVIMSLEAQAADAEARARNLARDAGERLRLAHSRIQSLEAALRMAEQRVHEANVRAQGAEDALKETQSRAAVTEAENYALAQRVKAAEMHADQYQQALDRVEDEIRTKLLNPPRSGVDKRTAAA
jgi:predicted  nucleic acid-binding Zn-ribbon protein